MFKKLTKVMLTLMMMIAIGSQSDFARAAEYSLLPVISVISANENRLNVSLSITDNGAVSTTGFVVGRKGTTNIDATLKLQKYNSKTKKWETLKSWSKTQKATSTSFNVTHKLSQKGTYRCKLTAQVTSGGKAENESVISGKKTY